MITVASVVPSSNNTDDSVSVAIIGGAIVGSLFIIIKMPIVIILLCKRRKKSNSIDDKQQHTHNTAQHDHTDNNASSQSSVDSTSRLETVNALYIPTNVKSIDSLLQQIDDRSRSGVIGCDVIISSNPSYTVNSLQTGKESDYQYEYVQAEVQQNKTLEPTTSGGENNDLVDYTPSYSPLQDVKLEDNPSYHKVQ